MERSILPQNYQTQKGIVLEDFQNLSGWGDPAPVADLEHFKIGTQGGKLINTTPGPGNGTTFVKSIDLPANMPNKQFSAWVYLDEDEYDKFSSASIYISPFAEWWNGFILYDIPQSKVKPGWNLIIITPSDFYINNATLNDRFISIAIRLYPKNGVTVTITLGEIRYNTFNSPRVLLTFDDAFSSVYNTAYPYMEGKGLKGTIYVTPNLIGTANYMTLSQLQDMYNDGWALGNHTMNHADLSSMTDKQVTYGAENVISQIQNCTNWLNSHGFNRASGHLAYPGGGYHDSLEFYNLIKTAGMLSARTCFEDYILGQYTTDNLNMNRLPAYVIYSTTYSLKQAKDKVDYAKDIGGTAILQFHNIKDSPSQAIDWSTTNFQALVDYMMERHIDIATIDEWYKGLSNPRYKSIPLIRSTV